MIYQSYRVSYNSNSSSLEFGLVLSTERLPPIGWYDSFRSFVVQYWSMILLRIWEASVSPLDHPVFAGNDSVVSGTFTNDGDGGT